MENSKKLIEETLKDSKQDIAFEPIPEENASPLSQAVVDKTEKGSEMRKENLENTTKAENKAGENSSKETHTNDAPEQHFEDPPETQTNSGNKGEEQEFSIPLNQATMMADTILGVVNNTLFEVGGGYFVTIRKHGDFYDFEEVIQVIDEQNEKNIKRIKLDEEDKAMLRPLLIQVLRKQSKVLSLEQQLLGVAIAIIVKKAKAVIEIRAENELIVERIREIIRKESKLFHKVEDEKKSESTQTEPVKEKTQTHSHQTTSDGTVMNQTGLPDEVLETA